ncbi:MAG: disulfide bond formation protein B [Candidatus Vogelbacteria bacterium]|nr:disulfide bond formation protein B [Candidatus Vogelbacteria bacterium]
MQKYYLYVSWFVALAAMFGSLYFSEILKLPPCVLCWYQRILMYPLTLIIPIAILSDDKKVYRYVLPMSILGMVVAFYHYLLYIKIIPDTLAPCSTGVSCTTRLVEWFGFINIPLLSFIAFTLITLLMVIYSNNKNNE